MGFLSIWAWVAIGMTVPLNGTVEDAAGRPVEGAGVWLSDPYGKASGPGEILGEATTDASGKFRIERPDDLAGRGSSWSPTLWAHKAGSRPASLEFKRAVPGADEPVRLKLGAGAGVPIRVVRPDGMPSAGSRVLLAWPQARGPRMPTALARRFFATTDEGGKATLPDVAPEDVSLVDVTAEGLVTQCLAVPPADSDEAGRVAIRPVGPIRVRVVGDDPEAVRGWKTTAWTTPDEPGYQGPSTSWSREETDDLGIAEHRPIAVGRIAVMAVAPEGSPYIAPSAFYSHNRAGEPTEIKVAITRGVRVSGLFREAEGGRGVPGVQFSLLPLQYSGVVEDRRTDAEGRFSLLVAPGEARFTIREIPPTHYRAPAHPNWKDFVVAADKGPVALDPFDLRRAATVRGRVVDAEGGAVASASVSGRWDGGDSGADSALATSDARGEFALGGIPPGAEVSVSARVGWAGETQAEAVRPGGDRPVTLRLVRRPTVALAGRVIGPDGRPLAGAEVGVRLRASDQSFDNGAAVGFEDGAPVRTGADGTFRTPAEVPTGYHYRVQVRAPGAEPAESAWIDAPATTFPDLALRRSHKARAVAGRVVDAEGRPVAGVEVYQSGDGPRRTRDLTDADGRFRVAGVPDSPAFLFARKAGFRFLGRAVGPGERSVDLALTSVDRPPPSPLKVSPSPISRAEERAIAREVLAPVLKRFMSGEEGDFHLNNGEVFEALALVDPARVVAMIENQAVVARPGLLAALALGRFEGDPGPMLADLDAIAGIDERSEVAGLLFDRLRGAPVEVRREVLGRVRAGDRAEAEGPFRAGAVQMMASRWLELGDADRAAPYIRELRGIVAALPKDGNDHARAGLAGLLAATDLPAALKLLEGQEPGHALDGVLQKMAAKVAATDPAGARALIGRIKDDSWKFQARLGACLAMASGDLAAARALADGYPDPVLPAILPALAARKRAGDADPDAARALLLESFNRLGIVAEQGVGQQQAEPSVAMAMLLPLASRVDPGRAPGYLWFAIASRPPRPVEPEPRPVMPWDRQKYADLAELAAWLAPYDRPSAGVIFAAVAERVPGMDDENWGLGSEVEAIFRHSAAFDARLARSMMEALPEDPTPPAGRGRAGPSPRYQHKAKLKARLAIARTLGLPPGLRPRATMSHTGPGGWISALED